jgi:phage tail protein X
MIMGATIAIGVRTRDGRLVDLIARLAKTSEYGVVVGMGNAEKDAAQGLAEVFECFGLTHFILLQVPKDAPAPLARGIEDELSDWVVNDQYPEFARFVKSLEKLASEDELLICFAAEWYARDRVRLHEGSAEDLLAILRPYGTWCQRLFVPACGGWQNVDEVPLVFRFKQGRGQEQRERDPDRGALFRPRRLGDTSAQETFARISDEGGALKRVVGVFATGLDPGESPMLQGVLMEFESKRLAIFVTDDDELALLQRFDEGAPGVGLRTSDIGHLHPWREAIGAPVIWAWVLTNQQGYTDGVQLEFSASADKKPVLVQLLALASEVKVYKLGEIIE